MNRSWKDGSQIDHDGAAASQAQDPGRGTLTQSLAVSRAADGNGVAPGAEAAVTSASSSSGEPLPGDLRTRFESSLGADLGAVRIHRSPDSAAAAGAVGAKAYALGNDIHFNQGQYNPGSSEGQHLIAHEVAHTVQQAGIARKAQFKLEVSSPGDAHEVEADRAAGAMVSGQAASLSRSFGVARTPIVQRAPTDGEKTASGGAGAGEAAAQMHNPLRDKAKAILAPIVGKRISSVKDRGLYSSWVGDPDVLKKSGGTGCNSFTITYGNKLGAGRVFSFYYEKNHPDLFVKAGQGKSPKYGDICEHNGGMNAKGHENLHVSVSLGGNQRIHAGQGNSSEDFIDTNDKASELKGWIDLDKLFAAQEKKREATEKAAAAKAPKALPGTWTVSYWDARYRYEIPSSGNTVRSTKIEDRKTKQAIKDGDVTTGTWKVDPDSGQVTFAWASGSLEYWDSSGVVKGSGQGRLGATGCDFKKVK